ncbi:hypothetical protein QJS66_07405 [Kocuria rhizophila]|nr:hypothetical protein QJS66_07405 [Kocuria rhizophila]
MRYAEQRRQSPRTRASRSRRCWTAPPARAEIPRRRETCAMTFTFQQLLDKLPPRSSPVRTVRRGQPPGARDPGHGVRADVHPGAPWTPSSAARACRRAGRRRATSWSCARPEMLRVAWRPLDAVLLQLVAKRLLNDYSAEGSSADVGVIAGYVADRAAEAGFNRFGVAQLAQAFWTPGDSASPSTRCAAPRPSVRCSPTTCRPWWDVRTSWRRGPQVPHTGRAEAFNDNQNRLLEAARCAQLLQWEAFTAGLEKWTGHQRVLTWLRDLFGLAWISGTSPGTFFLQAGSPCASGRALGVAYIDRSCAAASLLLELRGRLRLCRSCCARRCGGRRGGRARRRPRLPPAARGRQGSVSRPPTGARPPATSG